MHFAGNLSLLSIVFAVGRSSQLLGRDHCQDRLEPPGRTNPSSWNFSRLQVKIYNAAPKDRCLLLCYLEPSFPFLNKTLLWDSSQHLKTFVYGVSHPETLKTQTSSLRQLFNTSFRKLLQINVQNLLVVSRHSPVATYTHSYSKRPSLQTNSCFRANRALSNRPSATYNFAILVKRYLLLKS